MPAYGVAQSPAQPPAIAVTTQAGYSGGSITPVVPPPETPDNALTWRGVALTWRNVTLTWR